MHTVLFILSQLFKTADVKVFRDFTVIESIPTQAAGGMPMQSRYCSTMSPEVKQQYLGHTSPMAFLRRRDRTANKAQEWSRA